MRIPVEWLGEYVDLSGVSDQKLSEALNLSGTENEIISGAFGFDKVVVGEIKEIKKHPNADRLNVTQTSVGDKTLQIVCGAPNIEVGQKVPVALMGATLGEFEIKEVEIRGVKSFGMICSESELGLSDDHAGIMILDARSEIGKPLDVALSKGGTIIEAELTPNRSDCFSVIGIARETAASLNKKLKNINFQKIEPNFNKKIEVEVKEPELCPRYIAKVVEGVKIEPSPKWLSDRLAACGVRSINNVVDVTNYVMLEWGQPLHAFDFDKISGGKPNTKNQIPKIIVRKAKEGEKIKTLDSVCRSLTADDLVIADTKNPIALAGVMGGQNSEVGNETTTIVFEAAVFNGTGVRKSAQRQGIRTEASNRFEKGVPLSLPELAIERAVQLLAEINLKKDSLKVGENTDVLSGWIWKQHAGLRLSRIKKFLGVDISESKVISILQTLGFVVEKFDFKKEARKHVGKPYVFGARYKTHGDMAFDCSYLSDYIYSLIGKFVGYTSLAQFMLGEPVETEDLKPGDILFVRGHIDKSVVDHYFVPTENGYEKIALKNPIEVGHNGIYIGGGRAIHARHYEYDQKTGKWIKSGKEGKVVEEDVEAFTKNPEYIGARRFIEDPSDFLAIDVPWWRLDVKIEEDILEEVGRIYGFDNIPSSLPKGELPAYEENKTVKVSDQIKDILVGAGYSEVINYSFISKKQVELVGENPKNTLVIANPISSDQEYMRTTLGASLLSAAVVNQDNFGDYKYFEIASIYQPQKSELPKEIQTLGMVSKAKGKVTDTFYEVKGVLGVISERLNISNFAFEDDNVSFLEDGQTAKVVFEGETIGYIGMVSEVTKAALGIKNDLCYVELKLPNIIETAGKDRVFTSISKFPKSEKDINLVFDKKVKAKEILDVIESIKINNLKKFEIIDIFTGKNLADSEKSVTIRLVFGSDVKTLEESEISRSLSEVTKILIKKLGAKARV